MELCQIQLFFYTVFVCPWRYMLLDINFVVSCLTLVLGSDECCFLQLLNVLAAVDCGGDFDFV